MGNLGDWIGVFLIIAVLFGNGGLFGGGRESVTDAVNAAINNQTTQSSLRDVLLSSANNNYETARLIQNQTMEMMQQNNTNLINAIQGFNQIGQKLDQLGYHMDQCCCSIKTQMLQDKYDALENQYRSAQNDLSNAAQSQYILNALGRFVAYPPAAAAAVGT